MSPVLFLSVIILVAFFAILMVSVYAIHIPEKSPESEKNQDLPKVSILLAARDEEANILRSLRHISQLNYPSDKLEVLIGNDQSTDNTASLVEEFIRDRPGFRLIEIVEIMGTGRGKANVLAHLAKEASGEYYFITDVDVALPPTWITGMLKAFDERTGIVSGTTMCEKGGFFETMQSIDWLHFMGYINAFAGIGVGCTSVGNNMAVRAKAYKETGGYEKMAFSITEDYRLFQEVTSRGWGWKNALNKETLGKATAIGTLKEMLHQRKRWLIGARDLPLNWKLMIILYGLFIPAWGLLWMFSPFGAACVWFFKWILQTYFIRYLCFKVGEKPFSLFELLLYEVYVLFNTIATAFFYLLPFKTMWKRRRYGKNDLV